MVPRPDASRIRQTPIRVPIRNPSAPWLITHHAYVNPVTRKQVTR